MDRNFSFLYFVAAALILAGTVFAKVELTGDPRCLVMNCILVK